MPQALLFADPRPLVKRLGGQFFLRLPRRPGVYLMRDASENILYVGKAKDLRQRLNSYRIANPDRLSKRHLRLLQQVARIEWKICRSENGALAKEAELLRSVRPKFNRAGIWPVKPKYLLWLIDETGLRLKISETTIENWQAIGPLKGAKWFRLNLAKLLWVAIDAQNGIRGIPAGWLSGKVEDEVLIKSPPSELADQLKSLSKDGTQPLINWIRQVTCSRLTQFEMTWLENELESLGNFSLNLTGKISPTAQTKNEQRLFSFA